MKEIGGYLEFELKYKGKTYHPNAVSLNLARNAVIYLVKTKKYKKIYIPYLLCDCIENLLRRYEIEVGYYHVDAQFRPIFDEVLEKNAAIYIVNYYGQLSQDDIVSYKMRWERIILDNTHAFFEPVMENVDTIYNARKYFGVSDGGYLYTDERMQDELESGYSYHSLKHLIGRYEKNGQDFYQDFLEHEKNLDNEGLKKMSVFTENVLRAVDYQKVEKIRTENFYYLHEHLNNTNEWKLMNVRATYMYPYLCSNGEMIRKKLIGKKIYIPTLWPNVLRELPQNSLEYHLVNNMVPIPIDQRYSLDDMEYILNEINN